MNNKILSNFSNSDYFEAADFISREAPWLVPDIGQAEFFLYSSKYSEKSKLQAILTLHEVASEAELHRPHIRGKKVDLYSIYLQKNRGYKLSCEEFLKLYNAICGIRLSNTVLSCSPKIVQAINNLRSNNESDEAIREFIYFLANLTNGKVDLRKIVPSAENNSFTHFSERETLYLKTFKQISAKPDSLRDALCYLEFDPNNNDVQIETKIVLPQIIHEHRKSGNSVLYIVEPSLLTLRYFLTHFPCEFPVIFSFENEKIVSILSRLYPALDIIATAEIEEHLMRHSIETISCCIFGNNIKISEKKCEYIQLFKAHAFGKNSLFILNPDFELESKKSMLHSGLRFEKRR